MAEANRRIYLDNAATSWPKPPSVLTEITRFYTELGSAAQRGSSQISVEVDRTISQCRTELASLLNANCHRIAFCFNATDGLNQALLGLISNGDHVVSSVLEHNSVLRPLRHLQDSMNVKVDLVQCNNGMVDIGELSNKLTADTKVCCLSHASNVTGVVQPIEAVGKICQELGVLLVVDAAQTVGHIPVDIQKLNCDVLIGPGHKGLMGPLGTGFICISDDAYEKIKPTRFGGTGSASESPKQPTVFPYRLESGNLNVGGIFGLLEGIRWYKESSAGEVSSHEKELCSMLIASLQKNAETEVYDFGESERTGVVSFNIHDQEPQTISAMLDSSFGIEVRAGLHCAPLMHKSLGTFDLGGTVRISPGVFNTNEEIDFVCKSIDQLTAQLV